MKGGESAEQTVTCGTDAVKMWRMRHVLHRRRSERNTIPHSYSFNRGCVSRFLQTQEEEEEEEEEEGGKRRKL